MNLKTQKILALLVLAVGVLLLVYMVTVESEPGLLPLALIAAGVALYALARRRASA